MSKSVRDEKRPLRQMFFSRKNVGFSGTRFLVKMNFKGHWHRSLTQRSLPGIQVIAFWAAPMDKRRTNRCIRNTISSKSGRERKVRGPWRSTNTATIFHTVCSVAFFKTASNHLKTSLFLSSVTQKNHWPCFQENARLQKIINTTIKPFPNRKQIGNFAFPGITHNRYEIKGKSSGKFQIRKSSGLEDINLVRVLNTNSLIKKSKLE